MADLLQELKDLTMLSGVPGQEKAVNNYLKNKVEAQADKIEYDNLGSLLAYKGTQGPTVILAGHVDEIGFIVTEITAEGFLRFQTVGDWSLTVMLAQLWQIHTHKGVVYAVTGSCPPHLLSLSERSKLPEINSLFLDLGVNDKKEAEELGIRIGDMVTPYTEFRTLGNPNYILAKALDNRIGAFVTMRVFNALKNNPNTFVGAFTVQEEVGLRGARTSATKVKPSIAIAIETGIGQDTPLNPTSKKCVLGNGPDIYCYDVGLVAHKGLREFVLNIADQHKIPYQQSRQPRLTASGTTDAAAMHLCNEGAASLVIGVPTRYIHSHNSIAHKDDIENAIKLLVLTIQELNEQNVHKILFN